MIGMAFPLYSLSLSNDSISLLFFNCKDCIKDRFFIYDFFVFLQDKSSRSIFTKWVDKRGYVLSFQPDPDKQKSNF